MRWNIFWAKKLSHNITDWFCAVLPVLFPQISFCLRCQSHRSKRQWERMRTFIQQKTISLSPNGNFITFCVTSNAQIMSLESYFSEFSDVNKFLTNKSVFSRYFFQKGRIFLWPPMSHTLSFMPSQETLLILKPYNAGHHLIHSCTDLLWRLLLVKKLLIGSKSWHDH